MSRAESVFSSDEASPIEVGIGLAQRAAPGAVTAKDEQAGWMAYWQAPDRDRGSIACAVVLPAGVAPSFVEETASVPAVAAGKQLTPGIEGLPPVGNLLGVTRVEVGKPLVYYFGAGWSKSGDFPDSETWVRFVSQFAERVKVPLEVAAGP
jgi:hypothetical protein